MSMAFGKPIIGVLGGDGRKIIEESQGGIICEENKESIAEGIKKIAALSKEERTAIGNKNREYYLNHLSIEKVGEKVNKVLSEELI